MEESKNIDVESKDSMYYVADVDELRDGERVIVEVQGREIAVFNREGELHALLNFCVHQGGPVCEGVVSGVIDMDEEGELVYDRDDGTVACPWHGWKFDLESGRHTAQSNYRIPTFEVVKDDGAIYISS